MGPLFANVTKAVFVLFGIPAAALLGYDLTAIRPRLPQVEQMLAQAHAQDADPPPLIRALIDANTGSPSSQATRLVVADLYPRSSQGAWHLRNALWQLLLPLHLGESRMYGLYAALADNGTDKGLSRLAQREYGRPLTELSPREAASVVAMTRAPTMFARHPERRARLAALLLESANRRQ